MLLWIVCLVLTLVLVGASAWIFLSKGKGTMRFLLGMALCVCATYIIYIPVYMLSYDVGAGLLGNVVNVLKVISLDADFLAYYDALRQMLGTGIFVQVYETVLAAMHILLPAVFAFTAVAIIMQCLAQLRLSVLRWQKRNLYVMSEVNDKAVMLAEDIRVHDPKGEILFMEEDDSRDHTDLRDRLHCAILDAKIQNVRAQAKGRKVHYYCIGENEEENLNAALAILSQLQDQPGEVQLNNSIFLFSKDPLVEPMVDSLDKGLVEVDVINEYQSAAYQLLMEHPLTDVRPDGTIQLVLCGFSDMNKEILRAAAWCGQLPGYRLQIRVLGDLPEDAVEDFKAAYPGLFSESYDIRFLDCPNKNALSAALEENCAEADYIVVANDSEAQSIQLAVYLRRFYYRRDPQFAHAPQIYVHLENSDKAEAVAGMQTAEAKPERRVNYGLRPFGASSEIYTFSNITDSALEKLAKNVHLEYDHIFGAATFDAKKSIKSYNLFEVNKRSNRANALHIRYKLNLIGLDYTDDPAAEEVALEDYMTQEMLDKLTLAEHDRWMAFLESEGWITASVDQSMTYQKTGLSGGRHNCPLLKMHPYICPFDELKGRSAALGLEDSTVYDIELIKRIPISSMTAGGSQENATGS